MSDPRKYSSNIADVSAYATYMENQLAERDKLVEDQQAEIARLQQQSVGWVRVFDENTALREEVVRLNGYYSPDRHHNDIEEARKQAAQECLDIFGTYYDEFSFADSVTEVKRKFGLEG